MYSISSPVYCIRAKKFWNSILWVSRTWSTSYKSLIDSCLTKEISGDSLKEENGWSSFISLEIQATKSSSLLSVPQTACHIYRVQWAYSCWLSSCYLNLFDLI